MADNRPNILLLFPDHHRFDWLGVNPHLPLSTPFLDHLAAHGTRFTNAVCPSPLCAPSRACLAAGVDYTNCAVPDNGHDYPLASRTFYRMLRESGYHVMGCGKFDLHKASYTWGACGRGHLKEWGFSDGIDNEGKWDAIQSGNDTPRGPYMTYLESRGLREAHSAIALDASQADVRRVFEPVVSLSGRIRHRLNPFT